MQTCSNHLFIFKEASRFASTQRPVTTTTAVGVGAAV